MDQVWFVAALWLLLALIAVLVANWLKVSTALSEIVVGAVAQLAIGALAGGEALGAKAPWITFLAGTGAIVLTFLAGAELDPDVFRAKWKESTAVGLVGFFGPFLGAAMVAHYLLGWSWRPSWLAGVALSTTIVGIVLAGTVGRVHFLIRRLRTLTFGLLTPFYFIRAGSFVSVPVLVGAPLVFVALFLAKMGSKLAGLLPTIRAFGYSVHDGAYYSLMMSTGLTFGTISALFGLNHAIIDRSQYSHLVATVIGSAVIPMAIANARFMPRHLLAEKERELKESTYGEPVGDLES